MASDTDKFQPSNPKPYDIIILQNVLCFLCHSRRIADSISTKR